MIDIKDKHNCCGCEACVQRCPKHCVSMIEDAEGFLYPKVDISLCINCGLCEKVCPELNILQEKEPMQVWGAKLKDKDIVFNSSSGGIFTYLANITLDNGGVVFGARFDEDWNVIHDYTETKEGLRPFCKSKYVQSRIGNSFKIAEQFLKQGRQVLFTGTPCQIKGLKLFLKRDYDKLLAVDVACHSVPSPKVWRKCLFQLLTDNNISIKDVELIDFRNKKYDWSNYMFFIKHTKGEIFIPGRNNVYMQSFLSNLSIRPSCESCKAKCGQSNSDLTIADFWGVNVINPDFYDNMGVSLVLASSQKGMQLILSQNIEVVEVSYEDVIKYNAGLKSDLVVHKKRNTFFRGLDKADNFINYAHKFLIPSLCSRIKFNLRKIF